MPKIVGEFRIIPPSIAFLYQLMEKCGTDGGLIENDPEIDRCGSFKCGRLHEKLKADLILFIAFCTAVFAALIGVVIAFLIELKIDVAVLFAALKPLLIVLFMTTILESRIRILKRLKRPG